jgi:hypothetical protein
MNDFFLMRVKYSRLTMRNILFIGVNILGFADNFNKNLVHGREYLRKFSDADGADR